MRTRAITSARRLLGVGLFVVLAGCTAGPGGCSPFDDGSGTTTTTTPGETTTTTEPGATSTTVVGEGSTTTTQPGATTTTLPGGGEGELVGISEVELGDCLVPATDDALLAEATVVACDEPHQMEVFAQFVLDRDALPGSGDDYPGGNELTWYAQDECQARFDAYTGHSYWTSPFDLRTLTPSFSTWDAGDRVITCLIVSGDGGPLTASAKG